MQAETKSSKDNDIATLTGKLCKLPASSGKVKSFSRNAKNFSRNAVSNKRGSSKDQGFAFRAQLLGY